MLNVLNDIEIAAGHAEEARRRRRTTKLLPHPADENYEKLKADLEWVDPKSQGVRVHRELHGERPRARATASQARSTLFRVDRKGEGDRFKAHDDIVDRKLLWHGTNVAVVAAICKTGLRIMPHSGGRVGKGIYLASENGKSINYVGWASARPA